MKLITLTTILFAFIFFSGCTKDEDIEPKKEEPAFIAKFQMHAVRDGSQRINDTKYLRPNDVIVCDNESFGISSNTKYEWRYTLSPNSSSSVATSDQFSFTHRVAAHGYYYVMLKIIDGERTHETYKIVIVTNEY
jgi:hypothetical protein